MPARCLSNNNCGRIILVRLLYQQRWHNMMGMELVNMSRILGSLDNNCGYSSSTDNTIFRINRNDSIRTEGSIKNTDDLNQIANMWQSEENNIIPMQTCSFESVKFYIVFLLFVDFCNPLGTNFHERCSVYYSMPHMSSVYAHRFVKCSGFALTAACP